MDLPWAKYLLVFAWSGFKFMVGVGLSVGLRLSFWEQLLLTLSGGIAGVYVFNFFGAALRTRIRRWRKLPDTPKPPSEFQQRVWSRFGLWGVALLTPPLFSPPIGAAIALAFGTSPGKAARAMTLAMLLWALAFAALADTPWVRSLLANH